MYRMSKKFHFKSLEIYGKYVGVWGLFVEAAFGSFQRCYDGVEEEGEISQIPVESQNIGRIPDKKYKDIGKSKLK